MGTKKTRASAKNYLNIIDDLNSVLSQSEITKVALAKMIGIEYVTLDKYLRKERNIKNKEVVKRMVVVIDILKSMLAVDILPLPSVINARDRTRVVLLKVDEFLANK